MEVRVCGVDEDVGVDDERPLTTFHRLIQGLPIGDADQGAPPWKVGSGANSAGFLWDWKKSAKRSRPDPTSFALDALPDA